MTTPQQIARALLEIQAVGFSPEAPITFKSGIKSPVYIDTRKLPYWPAQWKIVIAAFRNVATDLAFDIIAGIETAGIPHSAALSYVMSKRSVFVRKETKEHGTRNRIEGGDVSERHVLLVEDLVTTGGSSLAAVEALRENGAVVEDCLTIVKYDFADANEAFQKAGIQLHTLTDFDFITQEAVAMGIFGQTEMDIITDWLQDPHAWATKHGLA